MASSVEARDSHSSGWGGRVVWSGEQAAEGWDACSRSQCSLTFFEFDDFLMSVFEVFPITLLHQKRRIEEQASKISIDSGWMEETPECDS